MMNARKVKDLVKNLSSKTGIESRFLLTSFMLERFLERVSLSAYQGNFVLKGGFLVAALIGVDSRSTVDMDATLKYVPADHAFISKAVREIAEIPLADGVSFTLQKETIIRENFDYDCLRISFEARLDEMRVPFHLDISTGDLITPKEISYKFKLMLEPRTLSILSYNVETILAEKLVTILYQGVLGTRMRDYYDVYALLASPVGDIDIDIFAQAVIRTARQRGQSEYLLEDRAHRLFEEIRQNNTLSGLWNRYRKEYIYARDLTFEQVADQAALLYQCFSEHYKGI